MAWEPTVETDDRQPLLEIGVSLSDLRLIDRALNSASQVAQAQDLISQFRNLEHQSQNQTSKPSKITLQLDNARRRVQGYIAEATRAPELDDDQAYGEQDGFVA